ncbi:MAG: hypothetical protein KC656_14625 [Myxococcales bacterium]|nr:hypothetical protein [Myxococcales bacterium]
MWFWCAAALAAMGVEERRALLDEAMAGSARVVVLEWMHAEVDAGSKKVQRVVTRKTGRPDATFVRPYDLAQDLRLERGTLDAAEAVARAEAEGAIPDDALTAEGWRERLAGLEASLDALGPVLDVQTREAAVLLHAAAARAERLGEVPVETEVQGVPMSLHLWEAARLSEGVPADSRIPEDVRGAIDGVLAEVAHGRFERVGLDFSLDASFAPQTFVATHGVFLDGREVVITSVDGVVEVLPGAIDVMLTRQHGPSLAVEVEAWSGDVAVLEDASREGNRLLEGLMGALGTTPVLSPDLLEPVHAYWAERPQSAVFVAIPVAGRAGKTRVWRYDGATRRLEELP